MKFTCSVEINAPVKKVVELFDDPGKLKEWQEGFVSMAHISGKPGKAGAVSKITYKTGKSVMELTETLKVKNLPVEMIALYEHLHMTNTMTNRFTAIDGNRTKWQAEIHYIKLDGFVPRLMARLTPGVFKKQTQKWLDNFKAFVERELK